MELKNFTIVQAHKGLVEKEFSCKELTEQYIKKAHERDSELGVFLSFCDESALVTAHRVDEKITQGKPLDMLEGIPVAIKDNMLMVGTKTTAASKILEHYESPYDATVIKKLKDANASVLGKTNMDEFAMGGSTENSALKKTKNPWDTTRVPGGSSGGSAVAVAADMAVYALGSDTGGSIRQPASLCGVVGFKPTYGTVSRYGLIAMASSLDQIGPFTKTVEDASIVFDYIKGKDLHDSCTSFADTARTTYPELSKSLQGVRLGIPDEYFIDGLNKDVRESIEQAIEVLKECGATIIPVSLPHTKYALSTYYILCPAEVSANMSRFDGIRYGMSVSDAPDLSSVYNDSRRQGLGTEVRRRIMLGTYVLAAGYYDAYYKQAQKVRMCVRRDFDEAFKSVDCLLTPTSPFPAFPFGERAHDPLQMYLADIFTVSANIAGVPGLSVPCGFVLRDEKNLPTSFQLLGKHFDDATVLRIGHQYQQVTDWHTKTP